MVAETLLVCVRKMAENNWETRHPPENSSRNSVSAATALIYCCKARFDGVAVEYNRDAK